MAVNLNAYGINSYLNNMNYSGRGLNAERQSRSLAGRTSMEQNKNNRLQAEETQKTLQKLLPSYGLGNLMDFKV